ncbi:hypothetical protein T10_12307 [Trichinella papuae]|uniref:Uncharacterized protein n=1 Tax=Trichinella papuae TaxID=268474 RepID=A0A0V1M913_9BILA|nr:hypothetical protein T10_11112 [Trichinella papuae]KRZ78416.1 hypothetical protein T10_12307 [Trichinella papuae]
MFVYFSSKEGYKSNAIVNIVKHDDSSDDEDKSFECDHAACNTTGKRQLHLCIDLFCCWNV